MAAIGGSGFFKEVQTLGRIFDVLLTFRVRRSAVSCTDGSAELYTYAQKVGFSTRPAYSPICKRLFYCTLLVCVKVTTILCIPDIAMFLCPQCSYVVSWGWTEMA